MGGIGVHECEITEDSIKNCDHGEKKLFKQMKNPKHSCIAFIFAELFATSWQYAENSWLKVEESQGGENMGGTPVNSI